MRARKSTRTVILTSLVLLGLLILVPIVLVQAGDQNDDIPTDVPADKAALLQQELDDLATAQAEAPTKPEDLATPTPEPAPVLTPGIVNDNPQGPFSPMDFQIKNWWQGPLDSGDWLVVYAGTQKDENGNDEGAALRVYSLRTNELGGYDLKYIGTYPAPMVDTTITITNVADNMLTIESSEGGNATFDLRTMEYK